MLASPDGNGRAGAQLQEKKGVATLTAGNSVFIQALLTTDMQHCNLDILQRPVHSTVMVTVQSIQHPPSSRDVIIQAGSNASSTPVQLPVFVRGQLTSEQAASITIVSLPAAGHLETDALPGVPLRVQDTLSSGGNSSAVGQVALSWHVDPYDDPSSASFEYVGDRKLRCCTDQHSDNLSTSPKQHH